eukprot:7649168-Alexandrium_andersonii.AAC.1
MAPYLFQFMIQGFKKTPSSAVPCGEPRAPPISGFRGSRGQVCLRLPSTASFHFGQAWAVLSSLRH